jgi:hypothetical protein
MPLRFTIRDLLWLTAMLALAVGWWIDRSKRIAELATYQREMQIERQEMDHYFDWYRQHGMASESKSILEKIQKSAAERAARESQ